MIPFDAVTIESSAVPSYSSLKPFSCAAEVTRRREKFVLKASGSTIRTLIPKVSTSCLSDSWVASIANLLAEYTPRPGRAMKLPHYN